MTLATAPRIALTIARTLTKEEVAQATGVGLEVIRKWTSDGTIPETFYVRGDDREYRFAPITVALIELVTELAEFFGPKSPIPKAVARQIVPKLEIVWADPEQLPARLTVQHGALTISAPLQFLIRAKEKLAAFAV